MRHVHNAVQCRPVLSCTCYDGPESAQLASWLAGRSDQLERANAMQHAREQERTYVSYTDARTSWSGLHPATKASNSRLYIISKVEQ